MRTHTKTILAAVVFFTPCIAHADSEPATASVDLKKIVFARRIEARKPVDQGDRVEADGQRVYGHLQLSNPGQPSQVKMQWARDGRVRFVYTLAVGRGQNWRTWSYLRARAQLKGEWTVTVIDANGRLIGSRKLTIVEAKTR